MNWQPCLKVLRAAISLALLLSGASVGCTQASADIPSTQDRASSIRETPLNAPELSDLLARAQADGKVRVIVGLRVLFKPEGELANPQAVDAQRAGIVRSQTNLLAQLSDYNVTDVNTFRFIPYVAITVDADALQYLVSLSDVTSIEEDRLVSPAGSH